MDEIVKSISKLLKVDGISPTLHPSVKVYRASQSMPRNPLIYSQGIIYMAQGEKKIYLGNKMYEYNKDNYIVLSVPLPLECEAIATDNKPLLAIIIDIEMKVLNKIINGMDQQIDQLKITQNCKDSCLFTEKTSDAFLDNILRLLKVLDSPLDTKILGDDLVKELVYRVMGGESASSLYALAMKNTKLSKIDRALKEIHSNYQETLDVTKLASMVNMSTSAFHHTFKEVTASSPIQYLKKIRLDHARNLIRDEGSRVSEAARKVGYESVTQFSREFKRYYGCSPSNI
jgi:AraC-like DNA-binding protein